MDFVMLKSKDNLHKITSDKGLLCFDKNIILFDKDFNKIK